MEPICHARDNDLGPECGEASTWRDETGNTYCDAHRYIAASAGELTFPIDATPGEMAKFKAEVHEHAEFLRGMLMSDRRKRKVTP